jgi:patatin-like phospholipase/acyl hydrolase
MQTVFYSWVAAIFLATSSMATHQSEPFKIRLASFDGGGIRGYMSLKILQEVDKKLPANVQEYIDWYAGTSTGAILAAAGAQGLTLKEMEDFYRYRAKEIFTPNSRYAMLRWFWTLIDEKYAATGINKVLKEAYDDTTLGQLERGLIITSYDIEGGSEATPGPFMFNSAKPAFNDVLLRDAVRGSSAAPTYFSPYYGIEGRTLIDGGMVANNPTGVAVNEILSLYDESTRPQIDAAFHILSFGTGAYTASVPRHRSKDMGIITVEQIINTMLNGSVQCDDLGCQQRYGQRYVRLNPTLPHEIPLDAVTEGNFEEMENTALRFVYNNPELIDNARDLLQN